MESRGARRSRAGRSVPRPRPGALPRRRPARPPPRRATRSASDEASSRTSSEIAALEEGRRDEEECRRIETGVGEREEEPLGLDRKAMDREPARVEDLEVRQE